MSKRGEKVRKGSAWEAAEAYGLDMSLVECNLRRTPAERIHAHSRALAFEEVLRKAVRESHARYRTSH